MTKVPSANFSPALVTIMKSALDPELELCSGWAQPLEANTKAQYKTIHRAQENV